ncbi:hypothetical protein [Halovivax cerinus]|uniref:Uncharacterized protein n=1 Tax=Halovivax cerinus TaxID=1487865 RepID=A0ABD5NMC7_9EURY|nr:hypothetical protein [Halovivax cerinus]
MATIITRTVNGSGPYAYRVEYVDGDHEWSYLGPLDEIEPGDVDDGHVDQATLDELEEMIADRDDSATDPESRSETTAVDFHSRDAANALRDRLDADALAEADDRRTKTVLLAEDAPLYAENLAAGAAADSKAHLADKGGQIPLTEAEKREIDFTRTNVMHARAVKGKLTNAGVDDWLAHYDPTISVDEHDAERALQDDRGARSDAQDTEAAQVQREADAFQRAESEAEDHARQGCIDGHEEACQELRRIGWTDAEIRELEEYTEPEEFARVVNDERKRVGAST